MDSFFISVKIDFFHDVINYTLIFIAANSFTKYLRTKGKATLVHLLVLQDKHTGLACFKGFILNKYLSPLLNQITFAILALLLI